MGKPNGGAHVKKRRELLERHGKFYVEFMAGKHNERDVAVEVEALRGEGIDFSEIVEARERAMKKAGRDKHKGAEVRVHS